MRTRRRPAEPHVAEGPAAFQPDAMEADWNRFVPVIERREEIGRLAGPHDGAGQRLRSRPALRIKLAQMRDRLLRDLPAYADRADQPPVRVDLAVLAARRVAQVHRAFGMRHAAARSQATW